MGHLCLSKSTELMYLTGFSTASPGREQILDRTTGKSSRRKSCFKRQVALV